MILKDTMIYRRRLRFQKRCSLLVVPVGWPSDGLRLRWFDAFDPIGIPSDDFSDLLKRSFALLWPMTAIRATPSVYESIQLTYIERESHTASFNVRQSMSRIKSTSMKLFKLEFPPKFIFP